MISRCYWLFVAIYRALRHKDVEASQILTLEADHENRLMSL